MFCSCLFVGYGMSQISCRFDVENRGIVSKSPRSLYFPGFYAAIYIFCVSLRFFLGSALTGISLEWQASFGGLLTQVQYRYVLFMSIGRLRDEPNFMPFRWGKSGQLF